MSLNVGDVQTTFLQGNMGESGRDVRRFARSLRTLGVDGVGDGDGDVDIEFVVTNADNEVDSVFVMSLGGGAVLFIHAIAVELSVDETVE